jgi:ribonuclease P protein component
LLEEGPRTRVGLIVPRFRQSAVSRNRVKRRLRELVRTRLLPTEVAADIVIRIRPEAYRVAFSALAVDVDRILVQLLKWRTLDPQQQAPLHTAADHESSDT